LKNSELRNNLVVIHGSTPKITNKILKALDKDKLKHDIVVQTKKELSDLLYFVSAQDVGDFSDELVECFSCEKPVRRKFSHYVFIKDSDEQSFFCKQCSKMVGIKENN